MDTTVIISGLIIVVIAVFLILFIRSMARTYLKFRPQIKEQQEKAEKLSIKSNYLGGIFEEKEYKLEKGEKVIKYYPGIFSTPSNRIYRKIGPRTVSVMITNKRIILPQSSFRTKGDSENNDRVSIYFSEDNKENKKILFRKAERSRHFWVKKGVILFVLVPKKGLEPNYLNISSYKELEKEGYILDINWFFPENIPEFLSALKEAQTQRSD